MRRSATAILVGAGLVLGLALAVLSGAGVSAWRAPVVGVAAGLLVSGLRGLVLLGRDELRRRPVPGRAYRGPIGAVTVALVLAALATA